MNSAVLRLNKEAKYFLVKKQYPLTPYIMVTFESSFADNYALTKNLLQNGMNVARINCAHDDEATWSKMINNLKEPAGTLVLIVKYIWI